MRGLSASREENGTTQRAMTIKGVLQSNMLATRVISYVGRNESAMIVTERHATAMPENQ